MRSELHIDLTSCTTDSHVPRAENAIRFVKERLRSIQCETPFTKYPKRLIIEITKRATVLINSFRRKSGVYFVLSPREISFEKKSKTPLCKMGEVVLAYDILSTTRNQNRDHSIHCTLDQMMEVLVIQ